MDNKKRLNIYISDSNSEVLTRVKRSLKIDKGAIVDKALTDYFNRLGTDYKLLRVVSKDFVSND